MRKNFHPGTIFRLSGSPLVASPHTLNDVASARDINRLPANDALRCHETFSFMMSHPAMSLRDRLCASREGGAGGGGWVHPKGANSMAVSGLRDRKVLVGTGRAISAVFGINGLRK